MGTFSSGSTITNELGSIQQIINFLPDNSTGVIVPKNFRDGFYTLWENSIIKPTSVTSSTSEYIGIAQSQLIRNDVNWYPKIYFGPKLVNGGSVMNNYLLENSDVDFFFYTTKDTTGGNYNTKLSFLAGTSSFWTNGSLVAPYLQAKVETTLDGDYIDLNITNPSFVGDTQSNYYGGNLNLMSENGYVTINNFNFPKIGQMNSSNEGKVLRYRWIAGKAYGFWEDPYTQSITSISSGSTVSIVGNPVMISGYRFSDSRTVATAIGGIQAGETFSDVEIFDLLRRLIYTYVPPTLTTDILLNDVSTEMIESGDSSTYNSLILEYRINKNATYSISYFDFTNSSPNYIGTLPIPSLISDGITVGTFSLDAVGGSFLLGTQTSGIQSWTLSMNDTYPYTQSSTSTLEIVLPFYYGVSDLEATQSTTLNSILGTGSDVINKLYPFLSHTVKATASSSDNKYQYITTQGVGAGVNGKGFIYFGYPSDYPYLVEIKDQNGFVQQVGGVGGDFYTHSISITSPNGWWSDKTYTFYISAASSSVPVSTTKWEFIFATAS